MNASYAKLRMNDCDFHFKRKTPACLRQAVPPSMCGVRVANRNLLQALSRLFPKSTLTGFTCVIADTICLVCYLSSGQLTAYSLPSLRPLIHTDFLPLADLR